MKIRFLALLLFLISCKEIMKTFDTIKICTKENSKDVSKFIIDCAFSANPKSDEEGEDLVKQCEETAKRILCDDYVVECEGIENCDFDLNYKIIRKGSLWKLKLAESIEWETILLSMSMWKLSTQKVNMMKKFFLEK